jgi:hypothetical protein
VLNVAILADGQPGWRPDHYQRKLLGSRLWFGFPVAKLLEWRERREDLRNRGVAGLVIVAQLDAIECRRRPGELRERKFALIRELYRTGSGREEVQAMYELIDWMITPPDREEARLLRQLEDDEASIAMPYITSAERIGIEEGIEKGIEQGMREGILEALRVRFGAVPPGMADRLTEVHGQARLRELHQAAILASGPEAFAARMAE